VAETRFLHETWFLDLLYMQVSQPVTATATVQRVGWWSRHQRKAAPYIFVAPFFVLFAAFSLFPIVYSLYISFFNATGLGNWKFIGLQNYASLLADPRFWQSVKVTTLYALGSVFILTPLAFLIALAFHASATRHLVSFYRAAYFIPSITSAVVVSLMFVMIFDQDYGLLNAVLRPLGFPNIPWIRSADWALFSIMLLGIWIWTGVNALYFLAGLQNLPGEVLEAAQIDGANRRQAFLHVTLPMLRPVVLFVVSQAIIGSYSLFAQPWLLTKGGPEDATLTMTMYLYINGFSYFKLGYASAIGYALVLVVGVLSFVNFRLFGMFRED